MFYIAPKNLYCKKRRKIKEYSIWYNSLHFHYIFIIIYYIAALYNKYIYSIQCYISKIYIHSMGPEILRTSNIIIIIGVIFSE